MKTGKNVSKRFVHSSLFVWISWKKQRVLGANGKTFVPLAARQMPVLFRKLPKTPPLSINRLESDPLKILQDISVLFLFFVKIRFGSLTVLWLCWMCILSTLEGVFQNSFTLSYLKIAKILMKMLDLQSKDFQSS